MASHSGYQIKTRNQMKTINVRFVSDELVSELISSRKEYDRLKRQKQKVELDKARGQKNEETDSEFGRKRKHEDGDEEGKSKKAKYVDAVELALAALEDEDVEKVRVSQPTMLFDDEEDISAKTIYNFDKQNSTPNSKSLKSCLKSPITPKTKLNVSFSNKENNTPRNKNLLEKIDEETTPLSTEKSTPYSLRKRVIKDIKKIQKILENSDDDFSSSGSDFSPEDSSDETSDEGEETTNETEDNSNEQDDKGEIENAKPVRRKNITYKVSSDNFFESQSVKKTITSNNTLKRLKNSRLTQEQVDEVFANFTISSEHKTKLKQLFTNQVRLFSKWDFALQQSYSVLLYGVGSKKQVVNKYLKRFSETCPVIIVNGFFPNITVKDITDKLCQVLKIENDSNDVIEKMASKMADYDFDIYLGINNIDGLMLRNKKSQIALSRIAKLDRVRVVATIDHINAPLVWDKSILCDFNWVWFDATTYLSYTEEVVYEGNIMLQNSGQLTLSSLRNVFGSLTKNSRGIFMVILKDQLSRKAVTGMSFRELYQECRRELLVSSDVALRSQLKEFFDHMILKQKRNADGEERLSISIDNCILKQFLDEQTS